MKKLRIKSIKKNEAPVYDIEMPTKHNFILEGGAVAHNCAHAATYGMTSYQTAYLKKKYPLEWWCSVLSNSSTEEITEKYWIDVQKYVTDPSVNESAVQFSIKGDTLVPPLKLIDGIGPGANNEIISKAPFSSLEDFLERVEARKVHKGTLTSLVTAGALNCLFDDKTLSLSDKLQKIFDLRNKKDVLPDNYKDLTPYKEYLLVKSILPIASIKLSEVIEKTHNLYKPYVVVDEYVDDKIVPVKRIRGKYPLHNGNELSKLINEAKYLAEPAAIASYGYIKGLKRFLYQDKSKSATELALDVDGYTLNIVAWPGYNDFKPCYDDILDENKCFLFYFKISNSEKYPIKIFNVEAI